MGALDPRLLLLAPEDNVVVARETLPAGAVLSFDTASVTLSAAIQRGHKLAYRVIAADEKVLKYGAPIGHATRVIAVGEHVHLHNVASDYTATHVVGGKGE